ncbi:putative toxin-antitoxin system antitoxin component (TIGR02293 family) [Bradyrhizobium sp. LM6.10]
MNRTSSIAVAGSSAQYTTRSLRTFQRRKDAPDKPLSQEQSGRTWKFAEVLAKATDVFGSQEEAEQWLERPAIGLDERRPIDLLATPAGIELVQSRLRKFEQVAKWSFCLKAAIIAVNRRDYEQTSTPEPHTGLQGEGGTGDPQG